MTLNGIEYLSDALLRFLTVKKLAGVTEKTLLCYDSFINAFIRAVGNVRLSELSQDVYEGYFLSIRSRGLSKATVATYTRHIKVFLLWLQGEFGLSLKADKIRVPKSPKKNPHIYSDDEIRQIFNAVRKDTTWIGCRNLAVVALMLDSGLRQNETCTLRRKDLNLQSKIMKVFGKGEKERFVPLGALSVRCLEEYFDRCPYSGDYVFYTKDGSPMTRNTVKLFIHKLACGLPFEFSSHKLRHNFATNFLIDQYYSKGSMDIYALLAIMGHEDVKTTERYLHIANQVVYSKSHISHIDKVFGY